MPHPPQLPLLPTAALCVMGWCLQEAALQGSSMGAALWVRACAPGLSISNCSALRRGFPGYQDQRGWRWQQPQLHLALPPVSPPSHPGSLLLLPVLQENTVQRQRCTGIHRFPCCPLQCCCLENWCVIEQEAGTCTDGKLHCTVNIRRELGTSQRWREKHQMA